MDKSQKKQMRFTDAELSVIKNSFAVSENDNDDLARALRKAMLQFPLDPIDESILSSIKEQKELLAVIRKTFLPTFDPKAPFQQLIDLWMTINVTDKTADVAINHVKARALLIAYMDQQLNFIETGLAGPIKLLKLVDFKDFKGKTPDRVYIDLIARNSVVTHTEQQITQLIVLAGLKSETPEETLARLAKDSMK